MKFNTDIFTKSYGESLIFNRVDPHEKLHYTLLCFA
jgi:hypothetical protein